MTEDGEPESPKLKSGVEIMLEGVRAFHGLARRALAKRYPDRATAARHMREARKIGRNVAPYIHDPDLRQRLVSDEPMSEEAWEIWWPFGPHQVKK
jgi:hypothetical protein